MDFQEIIDFVTGPNAYPMFFLLMIACGMGFPLNSDLTLIFVGFISGLGKLSPEVLMVLAGVGMSTGDTITYFLGKKNGFKLLKLWPFYLVFKKQKVLRAGRFVRKRGPKVLLMIRFIPGTRTVTILTCGILKLDFKKFYLYNTSAVFVLTSTLILVGNQFVTSLDQAKENAPYLLFGLASLVVLGVLGARFVQKAQKKILPSSSSAAQ